MNSPLGSQYEGFDAQYRQHSEDSAYNAHYDRPAVLVELGEVAGKQVLDAACGPGLYASELIERGAQVTAFDASQAMVELARNRVGAGVWIDQAILGEPLPYGDASFRHGCLCAGHPLRVRAERRVRRVPPGASSRWTAGGVDSAPHYRLVA